MPSWNELLEWQLVVQGQRRKVRSKSATSLLRKTASWARSWSLCPFESQLRSKTLFTMFRPCQLLAQPHITPNSSHQVSPFNQSQDWQIDDFVAGIWRTHAFCSSIAPDLGNTQRRFLRLGNGTYSTHITSDWHTNYKHAAWCIYLCDLDVNPWLRTIKIKALTKKPILWCGDHLTTPWLLTHLTHGTHGTHGTCTSFSSVATKPLQLSWRPEVSSRGQTKIKWLPRDSLVTHQRSFFIDVNNVNIIIVYSNLYVKTICL